MNRNYKIKPYIYMEFKENVPGTSNEKDNFNKSETLEAINALSFLVENVDSDQYSKPIEKRQKEADKVMQYVSTHGAREPLSETLMKINLSKSDFSHGDERLESISLSKEDLVKTRASVNALLDKWEARM